MSIVSLRDRRVIVAQAPLPRKDTSVCQHLSSLTARLSALVFLKARLSEACRCLTVVRLRSSVVAHPRPSLSGTSVPWVSLVESCCRVRVVFVVVVEVVRSAFVCD